MMNKENWLKKGYADEAVDKGIDLRKEIKKLCKEKNAVILGHFYQADEIQEIAWHLHNGPQRLLQISLSCAAYILWEKQLKFFVPTRRCLYPI